MEYEEAAQQHLSRPVSTQENKHRPDWTFFHLVLSTPPYQKVENTSTLYHQVADHRFKLEQKIGTESPCAGLFFVPIGSDQMFIFLSGNRPLPVPLGRKKTISDGENRLT